MNAFRSPLRIFFALSLVALAAAWTAAAGQGRDLRVVSARAGGVNYVLGDVKFRRKGAVEWKTLSTSDTLDSGDAVKTGQAAVVEVLLNPGSYLRAGGSTEFELTDAALDDLRLKLARGSFVIEAMGYSESGLEIRVATPQTQAAIQATGIYRFNAKPEGLTEVVVEKGRALVGTGLAATVVKGGKVVRVRRGAPQEIVKFDKRTRDELDLWSRERGKELAQANSRISRRHTNTLLASVRAGDVFGRSSGGFWYYNPRNHCFTFMPFYGGWRSPYGGWYDTALYYGPCPTCHTYNNNNDWWNNNAGSRPPAPSPAPVPDMAPRPVIERAPVTSGGWGHKGAATDAKP